MREIKFRAWDTTAEKMISSDELMADYRYFDLMVFAANGYRTRAMQYTGLKDKNGKEIYEGDVVSNREQERQSSDVGIVRYDTKSGCLVINNNNGRTKRLTVKVIKNNRVEVIGNIYENPEMLT